MEQNVKLDLTIQEPGRSPEVLQVVAMSRVICSSFLAHRKRFLQSCDPRFLHFTAHFFWIYSGIRSTERTAVRCLGLQPFTWSRRDCRGSGMGRSTSHPRAFAFTRLSINRASSAASPVGRDSGETIQYFQVDTPDSSQHSTGPWQAALDAVRY